MDGNATLTILTSTRDMNNAMLTVARIRQRRGSGVYDSALAAELGLTCTTLVEPRNTSSHWTNNPASSERLDEWQTLITVQFQFRICGARDLNHSVTTSRFACNIAIGHVPYEMRGLRTVGQTMGGLI